MRLFLRSRKVYRINGCPQTGASIDSLLLAIDGISCCIVVNTELIRARHFPASRVDSTLVESTRLESTRHAQLVGAHYANLIEPS